MQIDKPSQFPVMQTSNKGMRPWMIFGAVATAVSAFFWQQDAEKDRDKEASPTTLRQNFRDQQKDVSQFDSPRLNFDGVMFTTAGSINRIGSDPTNHSRMILSGVWQPDSTTPHYNAFLTGVKEQLPKDVKAYLAGEGRGDILARVNALVDGNISFADDQKQFGVADYWQNPEETTLHGQGDCEDYAILKKRLLMDMGVPSQDIFLAYVRTPFNGQNVAHMILLVNDAQGKTMVLDSLHTPKSAPSLSQYVQQTGTEVVFLMGDRSIYQPNGRWSEAKMSSHPRLLPG